MCIDLCFIHTISDIIFWFAISQQKLQDKMGWSGEATEEATGQECPWIPPPIWSHAVCCQCHPAQTRNYKVNLVCLCTVSLSLCDIAGWRANGVGKGNM